MNVYLETLKQKLLGNHRFAWTALDEKKTQAALIMLSDEIMSRNIVDVVRDWRMNRALLAQKMKVDYRHFYMKVLGTNPIYTFSKPDINRLQKAMNELAQDIKGIL